MLTIEVNSPKNADLFFWPISKRVRGRLDVHRMLPFDKDAAPLLRQWPEPVPGQQIAIDPAKKKGYIIEPLRDEKNAALREKVEAQNVRVPVASVEHDNIDVPTWLTWMKAACNAGAATVVSGELPDKIEGNVKRSFISGERKSESAQLSVAIDRQTAAFEKLGATMEKLLSAVLKAK